MLGEGEGGDSFALDELDAGVAEGDAEGSGDGASDDDGFCGKGEEGRGDEGEERTASLCGGASCA